MSETDRERKRERKKEKRERERRERERGALLQHAHAHVVACDAGTSSFSVHVVSPYLPAKACTMSMIESQKGRPMPIWTSGLGRRITVHFLTWLCGSAKCKKKLNFLGTKKKT